MGNAQSANKLMDSDRVQALTFLDEGEFSKIYKGHLVNVYGPKVAIKVPRVPAEIRKEKSEFCKKKNPFLRLSLHFFFFRARENAY